MRKIQVAVFALVLILCPLPSIAASDAKVTVKVVGEDGLPIEDAHISICFFGGCVKNDAIKGSTDSSGQYTVSSTSSDGRIRGGVGKEGFYSSAFSQSFSPFGKKFGRWQPWDKQLTVVIRPIINPVPMYVRKATFLVPVLSKYIGFDLQKSDWVAPYGHGKYSDFIIRTERKITKEEIDSSLSISFSNRNDGIQTVKSESDTFDSGSFYKLPRFAPEDGYQVESIHQIYQGPKGVVRSNKSLNYIFRVRTEVDEDGRIIKGLYGKIRGDIEFGPLEGDSGAFKMHYYLNPDGTRNLEYDPKKNLFLNLPLMESPAYP